MFFFDRTKLEEYGSRFPLRDKSSAFLGTKITRKSAIDVPPKINFSKIVHPGHSYSNPPLPPSIWFCKKSGSKCVGSSVFFVLTEKRILLSINTPYISFVKRRFKCFCLCLKNTFPVALLLCYFHPINRFPNGFLRKGRRKKNPLKIPTLPRQFTPSPPISFSKFFHPPRLFHPSPTHFYFWLKIKSTYKLFG